MAYHVADFMLSKSFTPKEPQVELIDVACKDNIVIPLINAKGQKFICCKVIEHFINYGNYDKFIICATSTTSSVTKLADSLERLTCGVVRSVTCLSQEKVNYDNLDVLVTTVELATKLLLLQHFNPCQLSLLIIQGCHSITYDLNIQTLFSHCHLRNPDLKKLGFSGNFIDCFAFPYTVETDISFIESGLHCSVNTTSDIVTVLHYGAQPKERLVEYYEYKPDYSCALYKEIEREVSLALAFLEDQQYEVCEYDGYEEDISKIVDPAAAPILYMSQFLNVLHNFGICGANIAASLTLRQTENLKMKTPYERHYLLLSLVSSVMVKIRGMISYFFATLDEKEIVYKYTCSKMLRLYEILRSYRDKSNSDENTYENVISNRDQNDGCDKIMTNGGVNDNGRKILNGGERWFRKGRADWDKTRKRGYGERRLDNDEELCGLLLLQNDFHAQLVFYSLCDLKKVDDDFSFLQLHFTLDLSKGTREGTDLERAYRKQEIVLKSFRMRECNLLIGTSFLESGIDLPRCNLVVRFDPPHNYSSYAHGKARARGPGALHCLMMPDQQRISFTRELGCWHAAQKLLMSHGRREKDISIANENNEDGDESMDNAHGCLFEPFCPLLTCNAPYVDLNSAISLVNRYCAKLPSDTFTRLTPLWNIIKVPQHIQNLYICVLRLPINSPIKTTVIGAAMPTVGLAKRFAALQTCLSLQASRELDKSLLPISKESFWQREEQLLEADDEVVSHNFADARPGTTKRRQYYNKRIAECLTDCRPAAGQACYLYHISMTLTCPLPDEQNTRGRKILPPETSLQGFGILTSCPIPAVGAFPIFTRAGEVSVELVLSSSSVILNPSQTHKIITFINFTFTSVLRLQKYLMMFDPDTSENSYFIVPTIREHMGAAATVDWNFLDLIYENRNQVPHHIADNSRANFKFDNNLYEDAVVCPWYRNQDQPQYFYVAEMCNYLSPKSAFPGIDYATFEDYYLHKYGILIQNTSQALLDVDHTSARLNFLTPRYVNRKGVALPTTSEEKKRARRENLGQKQILVPELCNVHPFPASLWQKAVCLPCILHRLNALLLANEVRRMVACDLALGDPSDTNAVWQPLDFGWNLADVLEKSRKPISESAGRSSKPKLNLEVELNETNFVDKKKESNGDMLDLINVWDGDILEVGTWSNDLAQQITPEENNHLVRYASPTGWMRNESSGDELCDSLSDFSMSDDDSDVDSSSSDTTTDHGMRIEFKEKYVAEAIESNRILPAMENIWDDEAWDSTYLLTRDDVASEASVNDEKQELLETNKKTYDELLTKMALDIESNGILCRADSQFTLPLSTVSVNNDMSPATVNNHHQFGTDNNKIPQLIANYKKFLPQLPYAQFISHSLLKYSTLIELKERVPLIKESAANSTKTECSPALIVDKKEEIFSFDVQPELTGHPGPSPSLILQALTMSNANDGINLERLETIGDSFLKYAITTFLYCSYENVHEGKLSHLRSKQVSNLNLYRLGKRKVFAESMVATKFEPHDNWLPPCYFVPRELERALIEAGLPANHWNRADLPALHSLDKEQVANLVKERSKQLGDWSHFPTEARVGVDGACFIPYNLMTQHSIPDKSIADCVEALIGAYLVACGPRGALLFMSWLGIKVLPREELFGESREELLKDRCVGHTEPVKTGDTGLRSWCQVRFGELLPPSAPLLRHVPDPEGELSRLLTGFDEFEKELQYRFRDRSYLLQAVTHASYSVNQLTDCYQRLEFLGDAVLDYLITRHLFEDPRHHSPGSLTDLRSALVNNTIFASLAVRHSFHRFFRHQCPSLHEVLDRFVRIQQENNHAIIDEYYLMDDEDCEDVEVPKALGDVFESVAGAIFLDSAMSLDAVWQVYYRIMKREIDAFSTHVPKSPIRELLELEPETAQFGKPEKLADGRRVRVAVEVFGKGIFKGIGRNYRIAKCTAAKCALKQLKRRGLLSKKS